jgi:uncharacterized membrane-anchored protein
LSEIPCRNYRGKLGDLVWRRADVVATVLVTFALGTAAGDWTLELTGWGPGISVLLPAGLIVAIVIGWRLGANAVLSFWLASKALRRRSQRTASPGRG